MLQLKLTEVQTVLCASLRGLETFPGSQPAVLRSPDPAGSEAVLRLAEANELTALMAHGLATSLGDWDAVPSPWRAFHDAELSRITAYLRELDRLADVLAAEDIPLVALKNGGIARGIHGCPGCCPMGDLDVLVERRHFRHAHRILLDQGYHFEFRSPLEKANLAAAEQHGSTEYRKILPGGETLWLELQWRPVAGRWIRPDQEPSDRALMARSVPIPGSAVRLLSPEDNLLQVALHTAKHSYVRAPGFRLHLDVERIVRAYPELDWQLFVQRVEALQVKTAVYISLAIPKLLLETPIPDQVLTRLKPAAWKEKQIGLRLQKAGIFNPHEHKFSRLGYMMFTALLYDDGWGLWRAIFPDRSWMRERYGDSSDRLLPYRYGCRLLDLALRRR